MARREAKTNFVMARPPKPRTHGAVRLFEEPGRPAGIHIAYVDGAARGNPGPASYAVIVLAPDGSTQFKIAKYIGRATNNVAEYYGLVSALDYAQSHGIARLAIRSDSELLVRQMQGRYKVKSAALRPLHERAQKMARALAYFEITHVPREQNSEADALANLALDTTGTVGGYGSASAGAEKPADAATPIADPARSARASAAQSFATEKPIPAEPRETRRVRARFSAGALHPLEALDLAEGEIVEISVKKPARH
jgi:ribonuclease HI